MICLREENETMELKHTCNWDTKSTDFDGSNGCNACSAMIFGVAMMDIYTDDEIRQSILIMRGMDAACDKGDIDQHASPAIRMAIDAMSEILRQRERDKSVYSALVNLFQSCAKLCLDDMNKLSKEITDASEAIGRFA